MISVTGEFRHPNQSPEDSLAALGDGKQI